MVMSLLKEGRNNFNTFWFKNKIWKENMERGWDVKKCNICFDSFWKCFEFCEICFWK